MTYKSKKELREELAWERSLRIQAQERSIEFYYKYLESQAKLNAVTEALKAHQEYEDRQ